KQSRGSGLVGRRSAAHGDDSIEALALDCSVHTKIGARAFRQRLIERNFDSNRSLLDCGIDASDVAVDGSVPRVNHSLLINLNILRLRFSDFDLCFQLSWVRHASEIVSDLESLADLHW